jgi:signal recognition particle subunit SRP54
MKDFEEVVDQKKAEEDAARMLSGEFTLEDFMQQVRMIQQMGPLKDLVEKIPGMGGMMPAGADLDGKEFKRIEAMIQSMTRPERRDAQLLVREPSRAARVANGSGTPVEAVNELVQKFMFIKQMMGNFGGNAGMLGKLPGMKNLALARNLRRAAKSGKLPGGAGMPGGFPGMPGGFPGMPGGFPGMPGMPMMPGMGMPGMGVPDDAGAPKMRVLSRTEKNARKGQRKRERSARKKNRGKN